ncbi:unnamed protein product, partial [marine sediment metagenome]
HCRDCDSLFPEITGVLCPCSVVGVGMAKARAQLFIDGEIEL